MHNLVQVCSKPISNRKEKFSPWHFSAESSLKFCDERSLLLHVCFPFLWRLFPQRLDIWTKFPIRSEQFLLVLSWRSLLLGRSSYISVTVYVSTADLNFQPIFEKDCILMFTSFHSWNYCIALQFFSRYFCLISQQTLRWLKICGLWRLLLFWWGSSRKCKWDLFFCRGFWSIYRSTCVDWCRASLGGARLDHKVAGIYHNIWGKCPWALPTSVFQSFLLMSAILIFCLTFESDGSFL